MSAPKATAPTPAAPTPEALDEAAEILRAGGLVGMPTETVYGLAADAGSPEAVARIFAAKRRPAFNPLISHVTGLEAARALAEFSPLATKLAEAFWPGPLTLVLPRKPDSAVALLACAGLDTIAIRAPAHPVAQALLRRVGRPLAAPSANPSGGLSPTTAAAVIEGLGAAVDFVLDGGPSGVGLESSVVAVQGDRATLLRPGGAPRAALEAIAGPLKAASAGETPASPGMLKSHYAPRAALRLNAVAQQPGEALLGFGPIDGDLTLSRGGDLVEAAANLFAHLRALDASGVARIAVAPIPSDGLGEAINDRLQRAAAPR